MLLTIQSDNPFVSSMATNALLPAIEVLKAKVAAKEDEIAPLRQQLAEKDAEINPLREMVNQLCKEAGVPPVYTISKPDAVAAEAGPRLKFRPDQFFNKELSQAAVEYLMAKKSADSSGAPTPATADEIYSALTAHGYSFTGTNENNNKTALKTALTRNTAQIAKINDELYGLRTWYGMRAKYKKSSDTSGGDDGQGSEGEKPESNPPAP